MSESPGPDSRDEQPNQKSSRPLDWQRLHLWQIQPLRDVLVVAAIFGVLWLGSVLSLVTVPLLLALVLAYLFEPVVGFLQRRRRTRRQAAATILGGFVLFIVLPAALAAVLAIVQVAQLAGGIATNSGRVITILEYPGPSNAPGEPQRQILMTETEDDRMLLFEGGTREERRDAHRAYSRLPDRWKWLTEEIVEIAAEIDQRRRSRDAPAEPVPGDPNGQTPEEGAAPPPADPEPPQANEPDAGSAESDPTTATPDEAAGDAEADQPEAPKEWRWSADESTLDSSRLALTSRVVEWMQQNSRAIATRALGAGVDAAGAALSILQSIGMTLFSLFLTCFFFFFLSWRYPEILETGKAMIPLQHRARTVDLISQMDRVVAGFLRGRLVICFCQTIFFTIAYTLIGVPAPLVIGPIVGVLSLVPYVSLVSIPTTVIAMALDSPSGFQSSVWWILLAPVAVYFIGQSLDDYVLTPLIQGKTTNMDTPTILFASLAGGVLAGVYGLLVAIPAAASVKILIREIFWPRYKQWASGEKRDILPIDRGD